jgi:hypothetical protein
MQTRRENLWLCSARPRHQSSWRVLLLLVRSPRPGNACVSLPPDRQQTLQRFSDHWVVWPDAEMRGDLHRQNQSLAQPLSGFASQIRRDFSDNEVIQRLGTFDRYAVRNLPSITGLDKQFLVP